MDLSKEELIQEICKRYGIMFPKDSQEEDLMNIIYGSYHKVEVINILKRGKAGKFHQFDLVSVSTSDLKKLAIKYSKRTLPENLSRDNIIKILLKKLDSKKLSENDLKKFGRKARSPLVGGINLYAGWIPFIKRRINEGDIQRGKREVKRYKL